MHDIDTMNLATDGPTGRDCRHWSAADPPGPHTILPPCSADLRYASVVLTGRSSPPGPLIGTLAPLDQAGPF